MDISCSENYIYYALQVDPAFFLNRMELLKTLSLIADKEGFLK